MIIGKCNIYHFFSCWTIWNSADLKFAQTMISGCCSGFSLIYLNLCFILIFPRSIVNLMTFYRNRNISWNNHTHIIIIVIPHRADPQCVGIYIGYYNAIFTVNSSSNNSCLNSSAFSHTVVRMYFYFWLFSKKLFYIAGNHGNPGRSAYQQNKIQSVFANFTVTKDSQNRMMGPVNQLPNHFFKLTAGNGFIQSQGNSILFSKEWNLHLDFFSGTQGNFALLCLFFQSGKCIGISFKAYIMFFFKTTAKPFNKFLIEVLTA